MALILLVDFEPSRWPIVKLFSADHEVELLLSRTKVEVPLLNRPEIVLVKWTPETLQFMAAIRGFAFIPTYSPICIAYFEYDPDTRERQRMIEIDVQREGIKAVGFYDVLPLPQNETQGRDFREQVLEHLKHRPVPKGGYEEST